MKKNSKIKLIKSSYIQFVEDGDFAVIWHSLFGYPQIVSKETVNFLNMFVSAQNIPTDLSNEEKVVLKNMIKLHFLNKEGFDEASLLTDANSKIIKGVVSGHAINYLELIMSEACNLAYKYCIHFTNLGTSDRLTGGKKTMTFSLAKKAVDYFLSVLKRRGQTVAEINFGGGEPLIA